MISIQQANPADSSLIARLSRQTFLETFAAQNTPENVEIFLSKQFSVIMLEEEVLDMTNIFFLAYKGDQPVGYAKMREGKKLEALGGVPAIEIARIYAVKEAIGTGVGKALMLQCIQTAKNLEKKILWLGVWERNFPGILFYERWGFEKFGTHIFMLGDDPQTDWLMKKEL